MSTQAKDIGLIDFWGRKIRVVIHRSVLYFVLVDLCRALDITNPRKVKKRIDQEDLASLVVTSGHQRRRMNCVNEAGLYAVIFESRKPEAKLFKRWVFSEVLPSIRRTGYFKMKIRSAMPLKTINLIQNRKDTIVSHINSLTVDELSKDMICFMKLYEALAETVWGLSIASVKSHLGLTEAHEGPWWTYLDDKNSAVYVRALDHVPSILTSLTDVYGQVSSGIERFIRTHEIQKPALRMGDVTQRGLRTDIWIMPEPEKSA